MSRRTSRSTIDRFCSLMSMKAMSMAPNSGTVRMSPTSLRVKPDTAGADERHLERVGIGETAIRRHAGILR